MAIRIHIHNYSIVKIMKVEEGRKFIFFDLYTLPHQTLEKDLNHGKRKEDYASKRPLAPSLNSLTLVISCKITIFHVSLV